MVDLFDKHILEIINENTSPRVSETYTDTQLPTQISIEKIKENLKYNASDEAIEERLNKLREGAFLTSENGKWRLTYKGKMILEDFWNTLSEITIKEKTKPEITKEIKTEEPMKITEPSPSSEFDVEKKALSKLQEKREASITYRIDLVSRILYNSAFLLILTGLTFMITGFLLIAEIYSGTDILILGFNAWIYTLITSVCLALITGINISRKSFE